MTATRRLYDGYTTVTRRFRGDLAWGGWRHGGPVTRRLHDGYTAVRRAAQVGAPPHPWHTCPGSGSPVTALGAEVELSLPAERPPSLDCPPLASREAPTAAACHGGASTVEPCPTDGRAAKSGNWAQAARERAIAIGGGAPLSPRLDARVGEVVGEACEQHSAPPERSAPLDDTPATLRVSPPPPWAPPSLQPPPLLPAAWVARRRRGESEIGDRISRLSRRCQSSRSKKWCLRIVPPVPRRRLVMKR